MAIPAFTQDFRYEHEGNTVEYTVIDPDAMTCSVKDGKSCFGSLILPANPKDGENEYTLIEIGSGAFNGCKFLTSVSIPTSVTKIDGSAFNFCSNLSQIDLPNSISYIGTWAFGYCSSLTSITIPNSVTNIEGAAFFGCTHLTTIHIPKSVISLGDDIFGECTALESVTVDKENSNYADIDGVLYNKSITELVYCPAAKPTISFPPTINTIGKYAFYFSGMTSLVIPETITNIGEHAFGHSKLISVTLPNSLTEIERSVFSRSENLIAITIPNSVTKIDNNAFSYCISLNSVTFSNALTEMGYGAFAECTSLTSIHLPASIESITSAFLNCNALTEIICDATVPPTCTSGCFLKNYRTATLYVPKNSVERYKSDEAWGQFKKIEGISGPDVGIVEVTTTDDNLINFDLPYEVYNIAGQYVGNNIDSLPTAFYIIRQGSVVRKIRAK